MTKILEIRETLKRIYERNSLVLLPIFKFILALVTILCINKTIGFMDVLKNPFIVIIVSLICSILPMSGITAIAGLLIIGHCFALGIGVAIFAIVLFIIMSILYFRFAADNSLALLITPLAFGFQIPSIVPISYGLFKGPGSSVAVANGVVVYYFLRFVGSQANVLQTKDIAEIPNKLKLLMDGVLKNQGMIITIIACVAVVLFVYVIRRLSITYSWRVAIFFGAITYVMVQVGAGLFFDTDASIITIIIGSIVSIVLALILEFFFFHVDYTRTEQLQFEDDEYYYYIKAVPKVSISTPVRDIRNISRETDTRESYKRRQVTRENQSPQDQKAQTNGTRRAVMPPSEAAKIDTGKKDSGEYQITPDGRLRKREVEQVGNPLLDSHISLPEDAKFAGDSQETMNFKDVDFEKKLEESLRNL